MSTLEISDYALTLEAGAQSSFFYAIHILPLVASDWNNLNTAAKPTHEASMELERAVAGDTTVNCRIGGTGDRPSLSYSAAIATPTWQTAESSVTRPYFTPLFKSIKGPRPRYTITELEIDHNGDAGDLIYNMFFEAEIYSYAEYTEEIDRSTVNKLYAPDEPEDAWLLMQVLSNTLNRLVHESLTHFCLPLFGSTHNFVEVP